MSLESPNISEPLPQVGAALYYDSKLDAPNLFGGKQGGKNWKLAGSCVLVSPTRILTIGHILGGHGESNSDLHKDYAVFFPYEGFFKLSENPLEWEKDQTPGDNLALATLSGEMDHWAPIHPLKIDGQMKYVSKATIYGYGSWPGSGFGNIEGLQQQVTVELGPPKPQQWREHPGWKHYDHLDVSWSSWRNGGQTAGRGNSGGPFLWLENGSPSVVGITREVNQDQQVGSWIGRDRSDWLKKALPSQNGAVTPTLVHRDWRPLRIDDKGQVVSLTAPSGATRVRATLNASQGMELQMGIVEGGQTNGLLAKLAKDEEASGQFLARELDLTAGATQITVGVCPVALAPKRVSSVLAQLCVLFT
jgi:hypothetical protein